MARRAFAVCSAEVKVRVRVSARQVSAILSFNIRTTNDVCLKFQFLFVPVLSHNGRTSVPSAERRLQHFGGGTV